MELKMARKLTDEHALDLIAELLSATEWEVDTIEHVADLVRLTDRAIDDNTEEV